MTSVQQRTSAWFKARRGKLTASNFGAAAGVNPWQTRLDLWKKMTGQGEPFKGNVATEWGTANEANALMEYTLLTKNDIEATGFYEHRSLSWLGGSPDGLVGDDGIVEAKCPYNRKLQMEIPLHYYPQINGLLEITGRAWCDFISWTPEGINVIRIKRNTEHFDWLLEHYKKLYTQVQNRVQPANMSADEKKQMRERLEEMYYADKIDVPKPPSPEPPQFDECPCANSDEIMSKYGTTQLSDLSELDASAEPAVKKSRHEPSSEEAIECAA